jgi:hydrogenase/urease accessory protein HupE
VIQRVCITLLAALLLWLPERAGADDFKPAYLQLTQTGAETYEVMWKLPALDESTALKLTPHFPDGTRELTIPRVVFANNMAIKRWRIGVPEGLNGKSIRISGLAEARTDAIVRVVREDGSEQVGRILPGSSAFSVEPSPGPYEIVLTYTVIGIEHILLGFDHLLFVLALVMIVQSTRRLLWTITAFTLAHSITLSLATLGVLHVPGPPVEAIIALSIVFVAAEIMHQRQGRIGLTARKPWIIAFAFGLLHGLGFAGALAEVGLPENSIPLALLFFNIGVEAGQILFILAVLALYHLARKLIAARFDLKRLEPVPVYLIGGMASYWVIERVTGFWG